MDEWIEVQPGVEILHRALLASEPGGPDAALPQAQVRLTAALALRHAPSPEEVLRAFGEWMRLDVANGHASPETLRAYLSDVRQYLEWLQDEGLTAAGADEEDLKTYRAWLVEQFKVTTAARKVTAVRRFYDMACARHLLAENPAARLRTPTDRTDQSERVKYLTFEMLKRLLWLPMLRYRDRRLPQALRDRCILGLMAMHGLRVVEVFRLNVGDLDPDAEGQGSLRVLGKGSKYRTILLTQDSRQVLEVWLKSRALLAPKRETSLFVTLNWSRPEGELPRRMSRRGIRRTVDKYLVLSGVKREGISCHSLRHSYATLSLALGADLYAISHSLGHSSITTTQVYAKIVDRAKSNPAQFLGGLLEEPA